MPKNRKFILSWVGGAALLLLLFYAAMTALWAGVRAAAAASLESQVSSVLAGDLSEGNLFKLGASLSRLMQGGALQYAEIRSYSEAGGWEKVFRTHSRYGDTDRVFSGFKCGGRSNISLRQRGGLSVVTTLPSNIEGSDCVALLVSADLPADLKKFRNRLFWAFGLLFAAIILFFLKLTMSWHGRNLALEVAARTALAEKEAAVGRMAAQVAHDIRSPLAALEAALKGPDSLPAEKGELARGALGRIAAIAGGLLETYKGQLPPSEQDLKPLAEAVLAEKRALYKDRGGVSLVFKAGAEAVRAVVQPSEFQRLLSNLLNNALEALQSGGKVEVGLACAGGRALLTVADDGKGIPAPVLARLGRKGETHGKTGGTGLGLYGARLLAEGWGGSLEIASAPGAGTVVTVSLPGCAAGPAPVTAVLIDDDPLVRLNWKAAARAAGAELKAFSSFAEFEAAGEPSPATPLYLDSDLGDGVKGEELAVALKARGFTDIRLATGHAPEKFAHLPWLKVQGKEPPWR